MIKVCNFNKSNGVSRFNILKVFFECINSKMSLTCCTKQRPRANVIIFSMVLYFLTTFAAIITDTI